MAGTEMKNVVLIALVVVVVVFAVYQYDSSLFGLLGHREGFENAPLSAGSPSAGASHGTAPAGVNASPGAPQQQQNSASPPTNPVRPGDAQSNSTLGNNLKKQPAGEGFADLSSYEGPASFGAAVGQFAQC